MDVISGYRWSQDTASRYSVQNRNLNDIFNGFPTHARRVCKTFPGPGARSLTRDERQKFYEIDSACLNTREGTTARLNCDRLWEKAFQDIWKDFFEPSISEMFFSGPADVAVFPHADGRPSKRGRFGPLPTSRSLEGSDHYAPLFEALPEFIREIVRAELQRRTSDLSDFILSSQSLDDGISVIDNLLWSLRILNSHMKPECRSQILPILSRFAPRSTDIGTVSLFGDSFRASISLGALGLATNAMQNFKDAVSSSLENINRSELEWDQCFNPTIDLLEAERHLSFLERVSIGQ